MIIYRYTGTCVCVCEHQGKRGSHTPGTRVSHFLRCSAAATQAGSLYSTSVARSFAGHATRAITTLIDIRNAPITGQSEALVTPLMLSPLPSLSLVVIAVVHRLLVKENRCFFTLTVQAAISIMLVSCVVRRKPRARGVMNRKQCSGTGW